MKNNDIQGTTMKPTDQAIEQSYIRGSESAWLEILGQCQANLLEHPEEHRMAGWIAERKRTVHALRQLCEKYGDNEWPDNLYLPDVIEKHLF